MKPKTTHSLLLVTDSNPTTAPNSPTTNLTHNEQPSQTRKINPAPLPVKTHVTRHYPIYRHLAHLEQKPPTPPHHRFRHILHPQTDLSATSSIRIPIYPPHHQSIRHATNLSATPPMYPPHHQSIRHTTDSATSPIPPPHDLSANEPKLQPLI